MLFQKLLKPANAATGIQYVGGYVMSSTTMTSNVSVPLTSLTGGVASSPSTGDLVTLYFGVSHNSTTPPTPTATGYSTIALLNSNDSHDALLLVSYKLLTAADTSITINANSVSGNALSVYVSVWRNIDATYPFDVAATTATGQNSVLANPPAITPVTSGSYIIAGAEGAHVAGTQTYSSSDLTNFLSSGADGSNRDSTIGGGYNQWTSGTFDPAQFTFSSSDNTAYSWAAATLALRPDTGRTYPTYVSSAGSTINSVFVPSHNSGDWLVVVSTAVGLTPPSLISGYTNITTYTHDSTPNSNDRASRVQYIISNGSISTVIASGAVYICVAVLRNVTSVGAVTAVNSTTTATSASVTLSGAKPGSLCLFSGAENFYLTGTTTISFATGFGGYATVNPIGSTVSGTLTYSLALGIGYFGAEFK